MDAEHRHELKQNDLIEWITHFPEYARENYMQIIGFVLVILGLLSWLFWPSFKGSADNSKLEKHARVTQVMGQVSGSKRASVRDGAAATDSLLLTANNLNLEADRTKDPIAKALILIKRGEALRSDLHYRSGMQDAAIAASQIQQAKAAYDAAILSATGQTGGASLVAMATYGLGLCFEEVGDFVKAEETYKSIIANAEFEGTVFPTQAANRIAALADNKVNVIFTKAPAVEVPAAPVVEPPAVKVEGVGVEVGAEAK
ncbi:MAG: hypothetical protein KAJ07_05220 [Planctomycetes bacterium]|nr:hypothetical protein [Planctomycetota bacterium]